MSVEELLDEFEHVLPSYIHAAFLYYYEHRGEIEKEIEQGQNEELWQERYPGGKRVSIGEIIRQTRRLAAVLSSEAMSDRLEYLSNW